MGLVEKAGGPVRFTLFVVAGLVLFVVIVAASLWGMDYGVEATVTDKDCSFTRESTVTVQEKLTGVEHTQPIGARECGVVQPGNFAVYHIRSGHLKLYDAEGGTKIWDSAWLD